MDHQFLTRYFSLLFLFLITNNEATNTRKPNRPRVRPSLPQTQGFDTGHQSMRMHQQTSSSTNPFMPGNAGQMPGHSNRLPITHGDFDQQPSQYMPGQFGTLPDNFNVVISQQGLMDSQCYAPVENPFLGTTAAAGTLPNNPQVQLAQQQFWDQQQWQTPQYSVHNTAAAFQSAQTQLTANQINTLYDTGPSTEFLDSASFNYNGRHRIHSTTDWANPATYDYERIVYQQKVNGLNYGDYEGEITLDFDFARPYEIDEEGMEEDEEEIGEQHQNATEKEKNKTKKDDKTAKTDRRTDTDGNSEVAKEKNNTKKQTVKARKLGKKFEKKQTEKEEKLRQYLQEQKVCESHKSDECWMRLFDALIELDDEGRYDHMRQYCTAHKTQIRFCTDKPVCDDIDKVIIFKKKTEEDEVVIEEEEEEDNDDNEEPDNGQQEKKENSKQKESQIQPPSRKASIKPKQSASRSPAADAKLGTLSSSSSSTGVTAQQDFHAAIVGIVPQQQPQQPDPSSFSNQAPQYSMTPQYSMALQGTTQPYTTQQLQQQQQHYASSQQQPNNLARQHHHASSTQVAHLQMPPVCQAHQRVSPTQYGAMASLLPHGQPNAAAAGVTPNIPLHGMPSSATNAYGTSNYYFPNSPQTKHQQKRGGGNNPAAGGHAGYPNQQQYNQQEPNTGAGDGGGPYHPYQQIQQQQSAAGGGHQNQQLFQQPFIIGQQQPFLSGSMPDYYYLPAGGIAYPTNTAAAGGVQHGQQQPIAAGAGTGSPARATAGVGVRKNSKKPMAALQKPTRNAYDFSDFNSPSRTSTSSSTRTASSSAAIRARKTASVTSAGQERPRERVETPEEHMGRHLKMYMRCINILLTNAPHNGGLITNEANVSKSFRQLIYGVMLPKPLFMAQQLNMALNGVPNNDIDQTSLMLAPSFSMTEPFEMIKRGSDDGQNKTKKNRKGNVEPIKQDVRVLLEIASTQSFEQLEQIQKISEAVGYTNFTEAGKIFIKRQSATIEAKESIANFLNWRLMGKNEKPKEQDSSKKTAIKRAKDDAKQVFLMIKTQDDIAIQRLIEILVERSNTELLMIQKTFEALYGKKLKKYINTHTNGDFSRLLYDLIDANRDEIYCDDKNMAQEDALTLFEGGVAISGTHEGKFIRILANANLYYLHLVIEKYNQLPVVYKKSTFKNDVEKEFENRKLRIALLKIVDIAQQQWERAYKPSLESTAKENYQKKLCPAYYYEKECVSVKNNASQLYEAFKGMGCDAEVIIKILVEQNNAQIRAITRAYNDTYGHRSGGAKKQSLRDRLKDELRGDLEKLALDLLEGNRNERKYFEPNCEWAQEQAAELLNPGKGLLSKFKQFNGHASIFIEILANEHFKQLRLIFEMYEKNSTYKESKRSSIDIFKDAIDTVAKNIKISNDLTKNTFFKVVNKASNNKDPILAFTNGLKRIVELAVQKVNEDELKTIMENCEKLNHEEKVENLSSQYFVTAAEKDASVLREAMKGLGTNEKTLIWILTTRKNNREIWTVYETMYGNDLLQRIKEETGGPGESDFQYALEHLLKNTREESTTFKPDRIKAKKQAAELYAASSRVAGKTFINMMATVHLNQLLLVFDEFEKLHKIKNKKKLAESTNYTFEELLKEKQNFSGDFLRTLLAIVSLARKGIEETEKVLNQNANELPFFKKYWKYLVELYKGYKPVTVLELNEFKQFVKLCDQEGIGAQACQANTIEPKVRELHEKYFTKQITRSLKDLLGIFKMPSTKVKAKIDLHRLIISRYQHDLGDILRSIDRLSLKQIVDRFEGWHFTFGDLLANGQLVATEDKLYAHALKRLLHIENARQITGYDDFLENYGTNLLSFMNNIDNDQYKFGVEMKRPKKGEEKRVSVNIHLLHFPTKNGTTQTKGNKSQNPNENKEEKVAKYLSESMYLHDIIQTMCQDLIDRLDLMYRARFKKNTLNKSDVRKFGKEIMGGAQIRQYLVDAWQEGEQQQSQNANEGFKPVWKIWGETAQEDVRKDVTDALYNDHVKVFKLLFWARFYALAIALQRVPVQGPEYGEHSPTIGPKEGAQLFGMAYNDYANVVEEREEQANDIGANNNKEMGATFRLDVPYDAWPDETRTQTEELRTKFEQDLDILEEFILCNFNHQMFYNGNPRFYQVGYETLQKLGYDDVLKGVKLRTLLVHEMEEMLEEVDTGVTKESDEDFSLKTVHFTKANVQLFKKRDGDDKLTGVQKYMQKAFNWLDGLVDKFHKKSLTKRNRMQRFLFDKVHTFTSEIRGLFTGQTPPIKWVMKKCMPMLYYGSKYGKKFLKWVGRLFKPMLSIFRSSKEKAGYKHKKQRLESKKAMFGLLMEIDTAVKDNSKMKEQWRTKSDIIWAERNEKAMDDIWTSEIERVKIDPENQLSGDARQEISVMVKEGTEVPRWMVNSPRVIKIISLFLSTVIGLYSSAYSLPKSLGILFIGFSKSKDAGTTRANKSRRAKRRAVRSTSTTDIIPQQVFADDAHVRIKRRGFGIGRAVSSRAFSHAHASVPYHPYGGSYFMGYYYHPYSSCCYYHYHLSHKELLAELWTLINVFAAFIILPISGAFFELDCSRGNSSTYHYDYSTAQRLREKEEKKRLKRLELKEKQRKQREKDDELDFEIAQWDNEIKFGSKNNSNTRRAKRSYGMDFNIGERYTEESIGTNKHLGTNRRKKRSAEDCGPIIAIMIILIWLIVWIGGYFFIAFGPI